MDEQVPQGEINKKPSKAKIDPLNLLECLKILLSRNGGIKDVQSVHRLVVLMGKYSKKLVSKCMYLNILLATDRHILDTFLKDGGWKMVSEWLCEGIKKANWPLAGLVLDLLRASPITLERLNDSDLVMVKQVKSLSVSCPHPGVSEAAKLLVLAWTRMLTAATASDVTAPHEVNSTAPAAAAGGGGGEGPAGPPDTDASSAPVAEDSTAPAAAAALAAQVQLEQAEAKENKDSTNAIDESRSGDETASSSAVKSGGTDEVDSFGAMHQEPILPKYIPTKKPKLKNRSKFVVAKRFKSKSVPVSAVSDEHTLVVQHVPSVLVVSPLPSAYIEHIAGVVGGGRPSSVLGGRRGRKKGQRTRHAHDSSSGESESRSDSPQKRIKITIKSGSQVLAQVSSKKSALPHESKVLSKQYVDTDDDDDDDEEEDEEDDGEVKHGNKRVAEDSDEDFVVEWTDKCVPSKLNKAGDVPSKAVRQSSSLKRPKKKVRAIMIESDDSMDSLPNIDQSDVGAGLGSGAVKTEALVNGDSQVPYVPAKPGAATASKPPQQEIKLKKFSVAKEEGAADGAAADSKTGKVVDSTTAGDNKPLRSAESTAGDSKPVKSVEDDKERSRHSSSSSSSSGKKNTKEKDRDKERSRGDDKDRNKVDRSKSDKDEKRKERDKDRRNSMSGDKDKKSSSGGSSISSKERDRERERRKEKERRERKERDKDQLEKDRSTLEKVKPLSTDGLAKIPKKPPSFLDALGSADTGESQVKKPPVKVKSSSFRSTGLLDPATPRPLGVAGKRVGPPTAPPQKTSANGATWPGPPAPSRKDGEVPRPGKRPPDLPLPGGADKRIKSTISSTPLTGDRPGGAKLISPKRPSLSDDGGFMAALDACSPKEIRRQKPPPPRRPRRPSDAERGEDAPDSRAASPPPAPTPDAPPTPLEASAPAEPEEEAAATAAPQRPPLNFYRDALEDLPSPDTGPPDPPAADPPAGDAAGDAAGGDAAAGIPEAAEKDAAATQEDAADASGSPDELYEKVEVTFAADGVRPVRSALVLVRRPGPKKSVRFRPEDALEQVHYFELDQTERVNVNAQKFQDMLLLEKHGERDALDKHRGRPQTCVQLGPWQLLPIHLPEGAASVVPGYKSLERHVQDKRQYSSMPTFFPPTRLPDTPLEPDPEPATARPEPPKAIPLNDTAGHDNVKSLRHIPWPDPVPTPPPQGPFYRHPQGPPWPRPMGGPPPPNFRPNGGPEYFQPPMEGMPMGGAADPMASTPPMGGPSGGVGGGHWVVGSASSAPHPLPKAADGPMFPGGGGPMMGGPGSYGHPPMGPMPPMPHPGYGPPPGGAWGGRMDEGERGPFRDGGWRRGGGPRGRGWGRGSRSVSKTPCRHFLKGGCRNGDDCGFAHTIP